MATESPIARVFGTTFRAGLPFGSAMAAINFLRSSDAAIALSMGALSGLGFGVALGLFVEFQRKRMQVSGDTFEGHPILMQGPANHFLGAEARGGWLILSTSVLSFRSHGKNFRNAPIAVPLADIRAVSPSRTLGIVPNGLRVEHGGGKIEAFVVSNRGAWVESIRAAVAKAPPAAA